MFIAHKIDESNKEQSLLEHLYKTAIKAREFGSSFNNEEYAYVLGLLHDIGKYSKEFQNRIKNNGKKCDHSTAGARIIIENPIWGKLGAYCIAGHHSGLQNNGSVTDVGGEGTLHGRLTEEYYIPSYEEYKNEIKETDCILQGKPNIRPLGSAGFSIAFLIRMLYSSLVDADFLDTEYFMKNGIVDRRIDYNFDLFQKGLMITINSFSGKGLLNEKRVNILKQCIDKSKMDRGLFTLTVPTGGGGNLILYGICN